jgi:diguanylate cyclase (GGDEF)-like protein
MTFLVVLLLAGPLGAETLDLTARDFGPGSSVTLPGDWSSAWEAGKRQATLHWVLDLPPPPPGQGGWALALEEVRSAFRLSVDGVAVAQVGVPGRSPREEQPRLFSGVYALGTTGSRVTLDLEVSSWNDPSGGRITPPRFGTLATLETARDTKLILAALVAGALLVMAVYHLALFLLRRQDRAHLWFFFFCVCFGAKALFDAPRAILWVVPDFDWTWYLRFWVLEAFLAGPAYLAYLRNLYPGEVPRWSVSSLAGLLGVLSAVVLFTPPAVFLPLNFVFYPVAALLVVGSVVFLARASAHRRQGARTTLVAGGILAALVVNDILLGAGVIQTTTLGPLGLVFFVVHQGIFLGRQLRDSHLRLEQQVREKTRDLEDKLGEIRLLAVTDPLTGVANRRRLVDALDALDERSRRGGQTYGLILADVDHFKQVNDEWGHLQGDEVLKEVARVLQSGMRPDDLVGRWGGEEFLVLLPGADHEATAAADRLWRLAGSLDHEGPGPVTLSLGWAIGPTAQGTEELIRAADRALYRAKAAGRDRVEGPDT